MAQRGHGNHGRDGSQKSASTNNPMTTEEKLLCFAKAILSNLDGIDQSDIEDAGIKFGLLEIHIPLNPCGDFCECAEFYDTREFAGGEVRCYRIAPWVKNANVSMAV